jgi:phosphoribosylformylglycinamidine cyclo-ligase
MINLAASLGIEAKIVGYTEASDQKSLHLKAPSGWVTYNY